MMVAAMVPNKDKSQSNLLDIDCYQFISCIGKACGGYANVMLCRHTQTSQQFALRICDLEHKNIDVNALEREVLIIRKLNHNNIIRCLCSFINRDKLQIVFPLMDFGSVTDVIHQRFIFGLPELAIAFIIFDLLKAVQYIHSRDCIHRSIRCSHILLSSEGNGRACLGGFRYISNYLQHGRRLQTVHEFPHDSRSNLLWLAPEVLQQNVCGYGLKSDIYSVGIAICEMANGFPPFSDMEYMQMMLEKLKGTTPRLLDYSTVPGLSDANDVHQSQESPTVAAEHKNRQFSAHFHQFTDLCLKTDPCQRPVAGNLLQHPFFKQLKKNKRTLAELLSPLQPSSLAKLASRTVASPDPSDSETGYVVSQSQDVEWSF